MRAWIGVVAVLALASGCAHPKGGAPPASAAASPEADQPAAAPVSPTPAPASSVAPAVAPAPLPEGEDEGLPPADVDETTPPPDAPPSDAPTPAPRSGRTLPTPATVLIIGDSKIATDFGAALQKVLARDPTLRVVRRGKSATGLSRPDFFDWTREADRLIAEHQPALIIVGLGGNDGQDLQSIGSARRVEWKSEPWAAAYGARVRAFVERLTADDRQVVWLEVTTADRPRLEAKLVTIRAAQREAIEAVGAVGARANYLPTQHHLRDATGGLVRTIEVNGRAYPLRIEDGIHFSAAGGGWLASRVEAELRALLRLDGAPAL